MLQRNEISIHIHLNWLRIYASRVSRDRDSQQLRNGISHCARLLFSLFSPHSWNIRARFFIIKTSNFSSSSDHHHLSLLCAFDSTSPTFSLSTWGSLLTLDDLALFSVQLLSLRCRLNRLDSSISIDLMPNWTFTWNALHFLPFTFTSVPLPPQPFPHTRFPIRVFSDFIIFSYFFPSTRCSPSRSRYIEEILKYQTRVRLQKNIIQLGRWGKLEQNSRLNSCLVCEA